MVEIAARVYRGEAVEAIHYATIAVVDGREELTHYLGDPRLAVMTRSSIKPFQVLPMLLSGAADKYRLSPKQLAVMCGSHDGTDEHREVVLSNLAAAGNSPEDLKCGAHLPLYLKFAGLTAHNGEDKDPARHNCSGKHSGFLAQAVYLGDDKAEYLNPASRTQRRVKDLLSRFCDYPADKMTVGVDGCSAPNFPLPIVNLAVAFMKLANARGQDDQLKSALDRVRNAMMEYPEMVSGRKRLDAEMMHSFPGRLVCKVGAEAIQGIGLADPPLGIAVKIHDGNWRARGPIFVEIFKQLGLVQNIDDYPLLRQHECPEVLNDRQIITGKIVPEFELKRV
ncbi:MAG: asparaginase [candidate division Zixibacteria bacterium]|nr:asparaginase [candidate division Zixibacteria bacterium]